MVAVLAAAWLQVAAFGHLRPLGVMPNVMLVAVILFSLWSDATPALAVAVGGGLLLDLASGSDFGLRMAFYVVVALAIIAGRQLGLHADLMITGAVAVVLGTLLYDGLILATLKAAPNGLIMGRIGRELIDNLALLTLAYLVRANSHRPSQTNLEPVGRLRS